MTPVLNQGDALFQCMRIYPQERPRNQEGLNLNRTSHPLVYTNDVILSKNIGITKRNTEALLEASREVGLEVYTDETNCMIMSCHKNAGQDCNLLITSKSVENIAKL
jgi:hypothetical protein